MASDKRSFEDLLKEAPKAPSADTVSVVGTLAQSHEKGKFVLTMGGGEAVTLDVSAVKSHEVLGSSVGQTVVRVDIERTNLPAGLTKQPAADTLQTVPTIDAIHTLPAFDHFPTVTYLDVHPTVAWFDQTVAWLDNKPPPIDNPYGTIFTDPVGTLQEGGIPDPTGGVVNPAATAMPFSLAAQHQAAPSVLGQLGHFPKVMTDGTSPWLRQSGYRDY